MKKVGYVYMLASCKNGTLYTGVTSDLVKRVYEHKHDFVEGFTKRHGVHKLVYYEIAEDMMSAIEREKQIKGWRRVYKTNVINEANPGWRDLYGEILDSGTSPE